MEKIEERYILGEIKEELFEKYRSKYSIQILELKNEVEKKNFDSSNLELAVNKMLSIAQNISACGFQEDMMINKGCSI